MNQVVLVLLILGIFFTSANGQEASMQTEGWRIFGTIGVRPMKLSSSNIFFAYVDESPSRDNMTADIDLKETVMAASIKVGAEYEVPAHIYFKVLFDFFFNQGFGFAGDFGMGYNVRGPKFRFRPLLMFSVGNAGLKLGDLYQNDLYIEVNRTRFYSESVGVRVSNRFFALSPQLEFAVPVGVSGIEIRFGGGYQAVITEGTPSLVFTGRDIYDEAARATESITANNVYLEMDGRRIVSPILEVGGPFGQIGVAYQF